MVTDREQSGGFKFDISKIRSLADVESALDVAAGEFINLGFAARMWGLGTPETNKQLTEIAANIASTALNLERAKEFDAVHFGISPTND